MVKTTSIYALRTNSPWVECADPGYHRALDAGQNLTTMERRDHEVVFQAEKWVYTSQQNVKQAVLGVMNAAVPNKYKRAMDHNVDVSNYKHMENPMDIIEALLRRYGQPSSAKKERKKRGGVSFGIWWMVVCLENKESGVTWWHYRPLVSLENSETRYANEFRGNGWQYIIDYLLDSCF